MKRIESTLGVAMLLKEFLEQEAPAIEMERQNRQEDNARSTGLLKSLLTTD